jgi:hypothetical protein
MPARDRRRYDLVHGNVRRWALHEVAMAVYERIAGHSYPDFYQTTQGNFVRSWAFRNLLGAMWLQMYFLLTGADQTRCDNWECNRVIAMENPVPAEHPGSGKNVRGKYKTRADRRFCAKSCANRHQYLTKTKPGRLNTRGT